MATYGYRKRLRPRLLFIARARINVGRLHTETVKWDLKLDKRMN